MYQKKLHFVWPHFFCVKIHGLDLKEATAHIGVSLRGHESQVEPACPA